MPQAGKPKYQKLFESLKADIVSGRFGSGRKMPSEAALVQRSGASRITVIRALRELQNAGLVDRVAGSGTYVRQLAGGRRPLLFGLLIPDLGETEIFGPICRAIANAPEGSEHALLWGHSGQTQSKTEQAWRLCQQYISRKTAGVFFAPLEFERAAEKTNRRILAALTQAGIAVVLLDRRHTTVPEKNRPDLVGLNNYQAAYAATEHLIRHGCRHLAFFSYHGTASTIAERMKGYRDALAFYGLKPTVDSEFQATPSDTVSLSGKTRRKTIEGFVCVNDRVAGNLMQLLLARKVRIPEDVRLIGIDDVKYASLLPVPLTSVRQPTREIGESAMRTMLDRLRSPKVVPREILLDGELIVRKSCGAHLDHET